jgi:hypothetical protein
MLLDLHILAGRWGVGKRNSLVEGMALCGAGSRELDVVSSRLDFFSASIPLRPASTNHLFHHLHFPFELKTGDMFTPIYWSIIPDSNCKSSLRLPLFG